MNRLAAALLCLAVPAFVHLPAQAKTWDARVHGRVIYEEGGKQLPVAGARIRVMDQDTLVDEKLASGRTGKDGRFDLKVRGSDPRLPLGVCDARCTRPDLYVAVELDDGRVDVQTEIGITWHANTKVRNNTSGDVDFGTFRFKSTDGGNAQILFARAAQQYDAYTRLVGGKVPRHDGQFGVLYPAVLAAGVPWTTEESVHWPGGHERWDAMFHEFGHPIRHAADGDLAHFLKDVAKYKYAQQHTYTKKTNEGYAFNEGWAEYHSTLLSASARKTFSAWKPHAGGDLVEGNVAAKLLDLHDACGGFSKLWSTLKAGTFHSYKQFEAAMKKRYPACFKAAAPVERVSVAALPLALRSVGEQLAVSARVVEAVERRPVAPFVKAMNLRAARAALAPQAATLQRLSALRSTAFTESSRAAQVALRKHALALKPITLESAESGQHRVERLQARAAFVQEALSPQLAQVETVLAQLKTERAAPGGAGLAEHLELMKVRYERRRAELRAALAARGERKVPVELLPRGFAGEVE